MRYELRYLGHAIDEFDTLDAAIDGRHDLYKKVRAGELPGFLDGDDIDSIHDFQIVECKS